MAPTAVKTPPTAALLAIMVLLPAAMASAAMCSMCVSADNLYALIAYALVRRSHMQPPWQTHGWS
eukprot:47945-Eustigmatos_ZCMA.PRE.1